MKLVLKAFLASIIESCWFNPTTGEALKGKRDTHQELAYKWCKKHYHMFKDNPKLAEDFRCYCFVDILYDLGWIRISINKSTCTVDRYGGSLQPEKDFPALKRFFTLEWESFHDKDIEVTLNKTERGYTIRNYSYDQFMELPW